MNESINTDKSLNKPENQEKNTESEQMPFQSVNKEISEVERVLKEEREMLDNQLEHVVLRYIRDGRIGFEGKMVLIPVKSVFQAEFVVLPTATISGLGKVIIFPLRKNEVFSTSMSDNSIVIQIKPESQTHEMEDLDIVMEICRAKEFPMGEGESVAIEDFRTYL